MRIAIDARMAEGQRVGVGVYTRNLIRALAQLDETLEIVALCKASADTRPEWASKHVEVRRIAPPYNAYVRRDIWEQITLPAILDELEIDLYHSPSYVLPVGRRLRCASALTVHDASLFTVASYYGTMSSIRRRLLLAASIRRADSLVYDSEFTETEVERLFQPIQYTRVAHLGVPYEFEVARHNVRNKHPGPADAISLEHGAIIPLDTPYIVSVGTLNLRKNYMALIRAMEARATDNLRLLIIGADSNASQAIRQMLERLPKGNDVTLLGAVPDDVLVRVIGGAVGLVLASTYEGFGLPILEAFSLGVPVCISDIPPFREVAGDAALYFRPESSESIARSVDRLVQDAGLRSQMVAAGAKRLEKFSWQSCAERHLDAYEHAIHSHRRQGSSGFRGRSRAVTGEGWR